MNFDEIWETIIFAAELFALGLLILLVLTLVGGVPK